MTSSKASLKKKGRNKKREETGSRANGDWVPLQVMTKSVHPTILQHLKLKDKDIDTRDWNICTLCIARAYA